MTAAIYELSTEFRVFAPRVVQHYSSATCTAPGLHNRIFRQHPASMKPGACWLAAAALLLVASSADALAWRLFAGRYTLRVAAQCVQALGHPNLAKPHLRVTLPAPCCRFLQGGVHN